VGDKVLSGFVGENERKEVSGTPRHRWEHNTKIDVKAVECEGVEWNNFPRHRVKWRGTRWRSFLRRCATSRKVAGSIPVGVIGIFH